MIKKNMNASNDPPRQEFKNKRKLSFAFPLLSKKGNTRT